MLPNIVLDANDASSKEHDQSQQSNPVEEETCQLCETGGELLLCDSCNGGFHINCVGLKDVPEGMWGFFPTFAN